MMNTPRIVDAVVVGAGLAGLYQLYRLREAGLDVACVDAAPDIGGTWHWNCYPGARLDSPSYSYQYWFSEELLNEWEWSERFPTQPEIKRYLKFVADKFDLYRDIQLNTRIESASWNEEEAHWLITSESGEQWQARFFVSCVGMLSAPNAPKFPNQDVFRGQILHTARWPQNGVDLKGKRIGVVGVGATGIQVIQTIAAEAGELYVFQRTPQYAVKMNNYPLDPEKLASLRSQYREMKHDLHTTWGGFEWDVPALGVAAKLSKQERLEILEDCWRDGSLKMWVGTYPEVLQDEGYNREASEFVGEKIRARIDDPHIADKLIPQESGFGTTRVPLESSYYDAYNRDNVHLVDVKAQPIEGFTEQGLMIGGEEFPLDVLIFATGFDAGTGALSRIDVRGVGGRSLAELWQRDIRSTLGLQVHGFPNLFTVAGPLAPATAFCNMATCLQQQVDWLTDAILYLRENRYRRMEPTLACEDAWIAHHDEVANMTLMMKSNSWYTGANIEGKPRRLLSYIGGVGDYKQRCDQIRAKDYEGFSIA
jgi:acetone monooxygenase